MDTSSPTTAAYGAPVGSGKAGTTSLLEAFKEPDPVKKAGMLVTLCERWALAHRYLYSIWAEAIGFTYGDQYGSFAYDARWLWQPRDPLPEKKITRISVNHMRPIISDVAALQCQDPPNMRAAPPTDSSAAASACETADQLTWALWEWGDYDTKNVELREMAAVTGNWFLYPQFDMSAGSEVEQIVGMEPIPGPADPATGMPTSMGLRPVYEKRRIGDFADRLVSCFEALPDPASKEEWDGEGFALHELLPIADVRRLYPKHADKFVAQVSTGANEGTWFADRLKGVTPRTGGTYSGTTLAREAERVSVYTIAMRTCPEFYRGRLAIVAAGVLVYEEDNPVYPTAKEEALGETFPPYHWPFFKFGHNRVTGSYWDQGVATFMIDPQKKLNGVASKKLHMLKRTSHPVLVKPKTADFVKSDEPDQQINVGKDLPPGSIYYLQSPVFPQELQVEEQLSVEQMEAIAGVHAGTRGESQGGNSGLKDRQLMQRDLGRLAIPKRRSDKQMGRVFSYKLRLWRRHATIERTIRVVGENHAVSAKQFSSASIAPGTDVTVYDDVMLPRDPAARMLHVKEAVGMGILQPATDPVLRMGLAEALGFGGAIRKFEAGIVRSRKLAADENIRMYDGEAPVCEFWHDDDQHLAEHFDEMDSGRWIESTTVRPGDTPQAAQEKQALRQRFLIHVNAHQQSKQKKLAAQGPQAVEKPKEVISIKDLPPEGQVQMAAQADINITPEQIAAKDARDAAAKAPSPFQNDASGRPGPGAPASSRSPAPGGSKVDLSKAPPVPRTPGGPPARMAA